MEYRETSLGKKRFDKYHDNEKDERCSSCGNMIEAGTDFGVVEDINGVFCQTCMDSPKGVKITAK